MTMKLSKLWSPMSEMTSQERKLSNTVTGVAAALAGVMVITALPQPAHSAPGGRMSGYSVPSRPVPAPPVTPSSPPVTPSGNQYNPGTFHPTSQVIFETPAHVQVQVDSSFSEGQILGYQVYAQDNGKYGNDQLVFFGPGGKEQIWVNCNVSERWRSWGNNSIEQIDAVVSQWCGWN